VLLQVSDTGKGMDEETKRRLFEPFFTTKEIGKGTGLGLSTVYGIIKQIGGEVSVYSEPGHGTTFKVYFPQIDSLADAADKAPAQQAAAGGTETLLLVEDESGVRHLTRELLEKQGYTVLEACDGREALRIYKQHKGRIDLLLTDVVMPMMNGQELADRLLALQADLKVIYLSGYAERIVLEHGVLDLGAGFLQKPFTLEALGRKIREVLGEAKRKSAR
jgi:two-component system cell cycle sensor histidine kinase/response regulator CckA